MDFQCKLCLKRKPLIRAHIIPLFFYSDNSYLISDELSYTKRRPIGAYDKGILCADCDTNILGKLDGYAKKVLFDKRGIIKDNVQNPLFPLQSLPFYRLVDKTGYQKLSKFFISILWRASVATQEDFSSFNLELYEPIAKRVILDDSCDYETHFSVVLCLLTNLKEPIHLFSPKRTKINGINCYIVIIGFYKVIIRCDKRKLPNGLQEATLSAKNDVLMIQDDLINLPEHKIMVDMIKKTKRPKIAE